MKKIEYPSLVEVEENIKSISDLIENHISKLTDDESEEFSGEFYEFIDNVKAIAEKYNLNPDSFGDYYKGIVFSKLAKVNKLPHNKLKQMHQRG